MDEGVKYFQKVRPDLDFMNEVFEFDVRELPNTSSVTISQYCIALSQYVIFMKSQMGKARSEINMKQRFIDTTVNITLTSSLLAEYKTKTAATDYIINSTSTLSEARDVVGTLKDELILLEGQDKNLLELVNTFKRELTRRDNEIYSDRMGKR